MKLVVTPSAVTCFREEWGIRDGEQIRIFVRYVSGGSSPYALGATLDSPRRPALQVTERNILFYMEEQDVWFLEGRDLTVDGEGEDIYFRVT